MHFAHYIPTLFIEIKSIEEESRPDPKINISLNLDCARANSSPKIGNAVCEAYSHWKMVYNHFFPVTIIHTYMLKPFRRLAWKGDTTQ